MTNKDELKEAVMKDACWQHKDDCYCDHAAGAESAFDYLKSHGYLAGRPPVAPLVEGEAVKIMCDAAFGARAVNNIAACRDAYRAILPHLTIPQPQWRPIGEAPRDATPVLLWSPKTHGYVCFGRYWSQGNYWAEDAENTKCQPTHFMPLPSPPAAE